MENRERLQHPIICANIVTQMCHMVKANLYVSIYSCERALAGRCRCSHGGGRRERAEWLTAASGPRTLIKSQSFQMEIMFIKRWEMNLWIQVAPGSGIVTHMGRTATIAGVKELQPFRVGKEIRPLGTLTSIDAR
jgi:hypothetical protein